ncbi:hypothetical protein KKI24_12545 [bacterium]|nr:hypothetical protein [bacterium]
MLFKRIRVQTYEVQTRVFATLFFTLIVIWMGICFMFFFNRTTYSNKHIDIKYLNSNLSGNTIKAIIPASSVTEGDNFIIENYLAQYVNIRESVIPKDYATKDKYVMAFTSQPLFGIYLHSSERSRKLSPFLMRHIEVERVLKLDETLFQVHFLAIEKIDYKEPSEHKKYMIATIRYQVTEIGDYDPRSSIADFDILNPLKLEVIVYTTAQRYS